MRESLGGPHSTCPQQMEATFLSSALKALPSQDSILTSPAAPALCPKNPPHGVAPELATIPQRCDSFCDLVPLHMPFPPSHPFPQMPSPTPPGRVGALFPALLSHFVHPCVTFVLLCYVSLIPHLFPWTRDLLKGQIVLFMFVYSEIWHRVCSL